MIQLNLPLENGEFLLYCQENMSLNNENVDIYLTNKNIFYGKNEKIGFVKQEYKYYRISLDEILILNNNYKIWTRNDEEGCFSVCILTVSNQELCFSDHENDDIKKMKAFMLILINILNYVKT